MDDGLVPYYSEMEYERDRGLIPCCSGRWSSTGGYKWEGEFGEGVLILVVVDDGLVLDLIRHY